MYLCRITHCIPDRCYATFKLLLGLVRFTVVHTNNNEGQINSIKNQINIIYCPRNDHNRQ